MTGASINGDVLDQFGRPLRSLRISVTDRCNLRCLYCMPEEEYGWLPREDLLTFEEITRLVQVFAGLGVDKVRLTGGEPLLRRDITRLVEMLTAQGGVRELTLTTNGVQLAEFARPLRKAGLLRVNISLDTLHPDRFQRMTRRDELRAVLTGVDAALAAGFQAVKLDAVMMRGQNDDEIAPLLAFGRSKGMEVRFLEYMDVGGATGWSAGQVFTRAAMLETIGRHFGPAEPFGEQGSAPAERFRLSDGTVFGIIASTTTPFCRACDRARLTADGMFFLCLYATQGHNLRAPFRQGASPAELAEIIRRAWQGRTDRGAESRRDQHRRDVFIPLEKLRLDPHLEMHTRGG